MQSIETHAETCGSRIIIVTKIMKLTKINIVTKNVFITKNEKHKNTETNYEEYYFSIKELIVNIALGCAGIAVISRLFFNSVIAFIILLPVVYLFLIKRRDALCRSRKQKLELEFRDVILSVSANLQAGYSVENAFKESYRDIHMLYGENSIMAEELYLLMRRLKNNEQLEDILMSLGNRSGVKDIRDFAEVFRIAKRNGGSLPGMINNTAHIIEGKGEVRREINTIMSEKRMEQRIMLVMPFGMMIYVSMSSPGFFQGLYHNVSGVLLMSVCLVVYAAAYVLGDKILKIEV